MFGGWGGCLKGYNGRMLRELENIQRRIKRIDFEGIQLSSRLLIQQINEGTVGADESFGDDGVEMTRRLVPTLLEKSVRWGGGRRKCDVNFGRIPAIAKEKRYRSGGRKITDDLAGTRKWDLHFYRRSRGLLSVQQEFRIVWECERILRPHSRYVIEKPLAFFIQAPDGVLDPSEYTRRWIIYKELPLYRRNGSSMMARDGHSKFIRETLHENGIGTFELRRENVYVLKDGRYGVMDFEGFYKK